MWLGFDDNREQKGSSGDAAWAWRQFMIPVVKDMPVQQFPPKPVLNRNFKAPAGAFLPPDPEAIKDFEDLDAPPPLDEGFGLEPAPLSDEVVPMPLTPGPTVELAPGLEIIEPTVNPFE